MFCRKCGHKLNDDAKFCPKCGTEILNRDDTEAIKADETTVTENGIENQSVDKGGSASNKHNEKPPKKRRKKRRLLAIFFICILLLGIQAARYYLGVTFIGNNTSEGNVSLTGDGSPNVIYELNPDNVKIDEESGICYVSNIIIVNCVRDASQEDIQEITDLIDGKIVGNIPSIHQYQIEVTSSSYDELEKLCEKVEAQEFVRSAYPDLAVQLEDESIPDDPWGVFGSSWSEENPAGNNWWIEAINAPSAWEYNNYLDSINIGILDSGFDVKHADLDGAIKSVSKYNNSSGHGTHVAGIIGAEANNKIGITGIVWDAQLFTYDWSLTKKQEKQEEAETGTDWKSGVELVNGIEELVVNKGCKVLNLSLGAKDELTTQESVDSAGKYYSNFLLGLLEEGYDFIIVESAGNGDKNGKPIDTKYNSFFCAIDENNCAYSENTDKREILERVVIVGAAQNDGNNNYSMADYSNYGDNVDIWAPGTDVYSTIPIWGYGKKSGTSMAAPVVTGVIALIWGTDTGLTGPEVKTILCDNESKKYIVTGAPDKDFYTLDRYGMVNAQLALENALGEKLNEVEEGIEGNPIASKREKEAQPLKYKGVVIRPEDVVLKMFEALKSGDYEKAAECLDPTTEQTIGFFGGILADIVNFFTESGMSWGQMLLEAAGATDVEVIECKSYNLEANTNLDIFSNILDKVPGVQNLIYSDADVYVKYRYKYKDEYYVDQDEYHVKRYGWSGWRIEADSMD